ncbi:MAG TPA: BON domain-containing protein [Myxococcota bacterium]|nr:BON domain-containing protein [Myxococcota bacterium]
MAPRLSGLSRALASSVLMVAAILCISVPADVHATERSDAWITTKIKIALLTTRDVSSRDIHVDTVDGRVTLYGTVSSPTESINAERSVKNVDGVHEVRDFLQVVVTRSQPGVRVSDEQLKQRVTEALNSDEALANSKINVQSVNAGVVLLSGTAASLSDHLHALEKARGVDDVRGVASEVSSPNKMADAEIWRDGPYDPAVYERSTAQDMWITTAVKLELLAHLQSWAFDLNVDSEHGVVTLFGIVDSERAKRAAIAEARTVSGVKEVKDGIQVVPKAQQPMVAKNDARLKEAIEDRLRTHPELADAEIDIDVRNGVARLSGKVKTQGDRLVALVVARTTAGVHGLVDNLKVEAQEVSEG